MFEVIQSYQASHGGVIFYPVAGPRRRARRMRATAVIVTMAIGFSGGVLQQFHAQTSLKERMGAAESPVPAGPFAYFPR